VCFVFNCYGRALPAIGKITLWTSLISFAVILITVPAAAPTHQHAKFVFATFINNTGWQSKGIAFIVGLVNTNWAFACLDCATHLAEEVHRPERMVPIAIMGTVAIGFVTSWFFSLSMFFSIVGSWQTDILGTPTMVPMLALFWQALENKAGAVVLESLIIATGMGCLVACHTWQSRLCWSFARDRGLPGHSWLSKVDKRLDVPLNAHFASCVIVGVVGCLYLASLTAFNA
jgi:choline transport protein